MTTTMNKKGCGQQFGHSSQVSRWVYGVTSTESSSMRLFDVQKLQSFSLILTPDLFLQDGVQEEPGAKIRPIDLGDYRTAGASIESSPFHPN